MKKKAIEEPTDLNVMAWADKQKPVWIIRSPQDLEYARCVMMDEAKKKATFIVEKKEAKYFKDALKQKKSKPRTVESIALTTLKKGSMFYTCKSDKEITGLASVYKVKVRTSRLFAIDSQGVTDKIVRVEIL
jgi:hypothetical protein